jgi:tetratricopeptide (TPR) repeat protein
VTTDDGPISGAGREDDHEARWYLDDERDFLLRSLEDAEREHDAGDLSDEDHDVLISRDQHRLAEVEAELAGLGPATAESDEAPGISPHLEPSTRSGRRRVGVVAACLLIVVGAVALVVHARQTRLPGQASSGSITLSQAHLIEQQLAQATTLSNQKNGTLAALKLFNKVLTEDPTNPEALAGAGFLQWNAGSVAHVSSLTNAGRKEVEKAIRLSPSYYQAHLYLGLILENQDNNAKAAVVQFNQFLADSPPSAEVQEAGNLLAGAYEAAGVSIPAALTAPTTTTTSTP